MQNVLLQGCAESRSSRHDAWLKSNRGSFTLFTVFRSLKMTALMDGACKSTLHKKVRWMGCPQYARKWDAWRGCGLPVMAKAAILKLMGVAVARVSLGR